MKHKMSLILFGTLIVLMIGSNQATGVSAGNSGKVPRPAPDALSATSAKGPPWAPLNHNHLGQTWTGSNSLVINGNYGEPWYAPLVLSNDNGDGSGLRILSSAGHGVAVDSAAYAGFSVESAGGNGFRVTSAGKNGFYVDNAKNGVGVGSVSGFALWADEVGSDGIALPSVGGNGLWVGSAGENGLSVDNAGSNGVRVDSAGNEGLYVGSAGDNGLYVQNAGNSGVAVGSANTEGFQVGSAGDNGLWVQNAGNNGVAVSSSGNSGLWVGNAGGDGVRVDSAGGYAGWFGGSIYARDGCVGCTITMFGVNAGSDTLQPGDIVSIQGLLPSQFSEVATLMQVKAAEKGETVIGVVQGRAEVKTETNPQPGKAEDHLVPRQGDVEPGGYVTIIIYGPAQVKASALSGSISAGTRLTLGDDGGVRTLKTTEVNGVQIAESASTIGIALEGLGDNQLIWVLVNPQ